MGAYHGYLIYFFNTYACVSFKLKGHYAISKPNCVVLKDYITHRYLCAVYTCLISYEHSN